MLRLLVFILFAVLPVLAAAKEETRAAGSAAAGGVITGTQGFSIPSWFKSSFLDIEEDAIEAGETGRHLLVFFHLKDCPYCAKMLGDSFADGAANAPFIKSHFDSVHINIRGAREVSYRGEVLTEKQFSRAIGVQYTPALLFFDESGQAALTINGYRSPAALQHALRYVKNKFYRRGSLTEYLQREELPGAGGGERGERYALRAHPNFKNLNELGGAGGDLSAVRGALMLIFEDDSCDECNWVHDNILNQADVRRELDKITAVRLDAKSSAPLISPSGQKTSAAALARRLNISYRPGAVFYENGKEIFRITGLLNHYHFREAVRYVALGHRRIAPRFGAYLRQRRHELLAAGQSIDYSL